MLSVVIPFIDRWRVTEACIESLVENSIESFELVLIDNGSDKDYSDRAKQLLGSKAKLRYCKNKLNIGVLDSFNQGMEVAASEIVCFLHNDMLIHESGWDQKIISTFKKDPKLGLAGVLGSQMVKANGGPDVAYSKILGLKVGKRENFTIAARYYGKLLNGVMSAIALDGVALFMRRQLFNELVQQTTAFDSKIRPPHHWYDLNISLYTAKLGWHLAMIDIAFDHHVGITGQSEKYEQTATEWLAQSPEWGQRYKNAPFNEAMYAIGFEQFVREWSAQLPAEVDNDYRVIWS